MSTLLSACLLLASSVTAKPFRGEGLVYRAQLTLQGEAEVQEARIRLLPLPARTTRNRVQRDRLGRWKLEVLAAPKDTAPAVVLARTGSLLYLSTSAPGVAPTAKMVKLGGQRRRIWRVDAPEATAHLADLGGGILALQHFEGPSLDPAVTRVQLDLESVRLHRQPRPAEEGMVLLRTLQRLKEGPVVLPTEARITLD